MKSALVEVPNETPPQAVVVHKPETNGITPAQAKVDAIANLTRTAYARASELQLTVEETAALQAEFPDDAFQPGAAGKEHLIYIEHAYLRDRFNSVFGMGQWAIVPRNRWAEDFEYENRNGKVKGSRVYVEAMLLVRGCFVGEAVGAMEYYPSNNSQNYGDAVEGAKTAALRRCAKELGVGLQAWKKEFCEGWWKRKRAGAGNSNTRSGYKPTPFDGPQKQSGAGARGVAPKEQAEKSAANRVERTTQPTRVGTFIPCADEKRRDHVINEIIKAEQQDAARGYLIDIGWILETETLADWPLDCVPVSDTQFRHFVSGMVAYVDAQEGDVIPEPYPRNGQRFDNPSSKPVEVPRDNGVGTWHTVEISFGKNKRKTLGQMTPGQIAGYIKITQPPHDKWTKDGKTYTRSKEETAKRVQLYNALQAARVELGLSDTREAQ